MKLIDNLRHKKSLFVFLICLNFLSKLAISEGTSSMSPNSSIITALSILPSQNRGSYLGCSQDNRIYFRITDHTTENFYYGFNWRLYSSAVGFNPAINNVYMKIFNPSGTLMTTVNLPSSGNGYINTWSEANIGANISGSNAGGYSPLSFDPSANGEYWVEFYQSTDGGSNQATNTIWSFSPFWDMQVATSAGVRHNGRLHCDKWAFNAMHPTNFYTSFDQDATPTVYAWSNDSVIIKFNFNAEFKPIAFDLAVTDYGVTSTGNFASDRKSSNNLVSPSFSNGFKLFVNVPDTLIYPAAPPLLNPDLEEPIIIGCSAPFKIRYTVHGAGDVRMLLDLNGISGYQANSKDVILEQFGVQPGLNTILWNGLDGQNNTVPSGQSFKLVLSYYKGRFNIPIYDAEVNKNGMNVTTIAPFYDSTIKVYWDDTNLPNIGSFCDGSAAGAQNNITGAGSNNTFIGKSSPCHAWSGDGNLAQTIPAPSVGTNETTNLQCDDFGNVRTINSFGWGASAEDSAIVFFACLQASGTIWNDLDKSANGTNSNIYTVGETGTNTNIPLYASLVDPLTGLVLQSVPVNANGTYTLTTVPPNTIGLQIVISTITGITDQLPPSPGINNSQWFNTSPLTQTFNSAIINLNGLDFGVHQVVADTKIVTPECGICPTPPICATADDLPTTAGSTTYTSCGVNLPGLGSFSAPDANGCVIFTGNGLQGIHDTIRTCVVACKNGVCDTTYIIINPPIPTPNPDVNQTWVNIPVTGDVSTNDENYPPGTVYANPQPNPNNPGTALPTINPDGTYTFTSPVPGVFTFYVPVITPAGDTTLVALVITVLDAYADNAPVANVDLAITPLNTPVTLNTLSNDQPGNPNIPLVPASVAVTINPNHGTATVDPLTGNITYTPNNGFTGIDTLTYMVMDANGDTAWAQQIITVLPANAPNTTGSTDDYTSTPFNTPVTSNALTNDIDAEGDTQHTVPQTTTIPGKGTLVLDANGNYTFTPVNGFYGPVEFPYTTYDVNANPDSSVATIHILVAPPVPTPNPDVNQTWVNIPVTGDVSTNDENYPPGTVYANPQPNPNNPGTALPTINPDGTYTFTSPVPGVFTFYVPVITPAGDTTLVALVITVLDAYADNAPVANVDLAITPLNTPVTLNTLSNDQPGNPNIPLVPASVAVTINPNHGTATVDPLSGNITYTPSNGFTGIDTLTYMVMDANGDTAWAQQIITVLPANAPNTTGSTDDYTSTPFNTPVTSNALTNDIDAEGDTQHTVPQTTTIPGKGTLVLDANGNYTFTPVNGFYGPVEFPYTTYDVNANPDSSVATIHILVAPPVPTPNPDVNQTWVNIPVTGDVSTNDENYPPGTVYANPQPNPNNPGTALPTINPDGTYTFTSPVPGVFTFYVPVITPAGDTTLVALVITVLDAYADNAPVANVDLAITPLNTPVTLNTLSNDQPGNPNIPLVPASVAVTINPNHGTATVDPLTGNITYTPSNGFTGIDTLTYMVMDANGDTAWAQQIITVLPANAPNTTGSTDDYTSTPFNTPVSSNALTNDIDAEGDTQHTVPQTTTIPGKGTLVLDANGNYTFTPVNGFYGPVEFPYTTYDVNANPDSSVATIHILVEPPVPTPNPDVNQTWVNIPVTGDVSTNDENYPPGTVYANPQPNPNNPGTALPTINPDGTYTFTSPVPGVFTFDVPVITPAGDTKLVALVITVLDAYADNAPVANVDLAITPLNTPVTLNTLSNDQSGNPNIPLVPSSVAVTINPNHGTASVDPLSGNITYTPNNGFTGIDTLTYMVLDANGDTAWAQQIITVLPANAPNTTGSTDDYTSTPFNTPVSSNVLTNDIDAEGDTQHTVPQTTTIPGKGTLVLDANGNYTFTPVNGFYGPVEFPYTTYDVNANPDSSVATIHILVAPPVPTPNPDVNQTWVNIPVTGDVSTNDENYPPGTVYANPQPNPNNPGTALPTINTDGTYTFTSPVPGVFTFYVPVITPAGDTTLVALVITVLDAYADNAPVANVDLATTPLNTPVTLNTLSNDQPGNPNVPLVPASVAVTINPNHGTATVDPLTGNITYTPNNGFTGIDTLTYMVMDANGDTAWAQQIITVLPANAPNTTGSTDDYTSTPFNTPVSSNALTNDIDAEGDTQHTVPQTTTIPGKGTLVLDANGNYTFTPVNGFYGPVEFPYTTYDVNANPDSSVATIHILVAPPVPTPNPDVNQTWVNIPVTGDVSTNDENYPPGTVYANPQPNPNNPGTALPTINPDRTYTFTSPVPGVFTFDVPVITPAGDTTLVALVITVLDAYADNAPVANVDLATTPLNTPVTLNTLSNDQPGNPNIPLVPASVAVTINPNHGTASVDPLSGNITYTPNNGFTGIDTLTYMVLDANGDTAWAQQIITVLPANAPNTTGSTDDYTSTPFNTPVSSNALTNDIDAEGDTQHTVPQTTTIPGKGTLVLDANGNYTFTPVNGFYGPVEFPYTTYDVNANPDSSVATIHILVAPPVPTPNPDVNQTWVNIPVTGDVSTNDENYPIGTTYGNASPTGVNPGPELPVINPDGTYTFTSPVPGVFTFNVPVITPAGDTTLVALVITVLDAYADNAPVANVDLAITPLNTPVTLNTLSNDQLGNPNIPLVPASVAVTINPNHGTATVDPLTGNITYTPSNGFTGIDTLTYMVMDANGDTAWAQQIITVLPANAPNTTGSTDDYTSTPFNTPVTSNALTNDIDAEGDTQHTVPQTTTIPGKGTLVLDANGNYTFTPVNGFYGPVEFPYTTYDVNANPDSSVATIHILVAPPVPTPNPDMNATWVNVPVTGDVSTNDNNYPIGTTYGNSSPTGVNPGPELPVINPDGTYTFTSPTAGVYHFLVPVQACSTCSVDSVLLTITVLDSTINTNPPVANTDLGITPLNTPITLLTLINDKSSNSGVNGQLDPASVSITQQPSNGTVTIDPLTGNTTYTPNNGFVGIDTLYYQVCDKQNPAQCASAAQIITIVDTSVTANSTFAADDYNVSTNGAQVTGNAMTNDSDAEGDPQTITPQVTTIPGEGTLELNADGSYVFTPLNGYVGPLAFPYVTTDSKGAVAKATIYFLVTAELQLPAIIADFNLSEINCTSIISWTTLQEINVNYFDVQKLQNNVFETIQRVQSKGNSSISSNYQMKDANVNQGSNTYRLRVVDIDEKESYSDSRSIQIECAVNEISLYPNPVTSNVNLLISTETNDLYEIKVIDFTGKELYSTQQEVSHQSKTIALPTSHFADGFYTVLVAHNGILNSIRFEKVSQ